MAEYWWRQKTKCELEDLQYLGYCWAECAAETPAGEFAEFLTERLELVAPT